MTRKYKNPYKMAEEPHPLDKAIDNGLAKLCAIIIVLVVLRVASFPLLLIGLKKLLES